MFQKKVDTYQDIPDGYPGQIATTYIGTVVECYPVYDTANSISPGDFVIAEMDNASKELKYAKLAKGNVQNKVVLGIVLRNSEKFANTSVSDEIPDSSHVNVMRRGSVYLKATADADVGHYVYLKEADGSLVFDAQATKTSHLNTGFRVTSGGKKDSMIIISA